MKKSDKDDSLGLDLNHAWQTGFAIGKDILAIFFLELKAAKHNLIILIALYTILVLLFITIWACAIWLFVLWLAYSTVSLFTALFLTILTIFLLAVVILFIIKKSKKAVNFEATREELKNLMELNHE